jgi:hypothetical protein
MRLNRVMCEWQRLLLQQHTDVVASSNITQWQSNGAKGWLCVSTVEDLKVAIDVHTTTITASTISTGSRLVWDINKLAHIPASSRDSILGNLVDFSHILSTCSTIDSDIISTVDTLCVQQLNERKHSLQAASVREFQTKLDVTAGGIHMVTLSRMMETAGNRSDS